MRKLVLAILVILILPLAVLEVMFLKTSSKQTEFDHAEVWIHRGGKPYNSLQGIGYLIARGDKGVEIDVEFHDGVLVMGHEGDVEYGLTSFEEVLQNIDDGRINYWLDLKNLTSQNVDKVIFILSEIDSKFRIRDRILIESKNPNPLGKISEAGFNSLYWINPHERSRFHFFRNVPNKFYFVKYDFIGVSMNYEFYNERVENTYKHLNLFTYTINDEADFKKMLKKENVKIILRDLND